MSKTTRLLSNHRQILLALMQQVVDCPAEAKAEAATYAKAEPAVTKLVTSRFPATDMTVLLKHEVAYRDRCLNIQLHDGETIRFTFKDQNAAPLVPGREGWGHCSRRIYLADDKQTKLIEAWVNAYKALDTAQRQKRSDYTAFINTATTYEQVLEVWPEAKQVEDRIKVNLPSTISPEMLARIKADSASRLKQPAK